MFLDVRDGHRVYYEEHGSPSGRPVVVLHGGPGSGLHRGVLRLFNLKKWRVILYDQRGCGRSTPYLSLSKNTTWDLVEDLERLRTACGVTAWTLFGGSWGTTLALAYASKYLDHITAFVLRGVSLMEPWETAWLYREGGASRLYPEAFGLFVKGSKSRSPNLTRSYSSLLKRRKTRKAAAAAWWGWEAAISSLEPRQDTTSSRTGVSLAVLENHYFRHNAWIRSGELLKTARRIPASIPMYIVQGRYDLVCPPASAVALANAVPHAKIRLTLAGHSASDPENAKGLREVLTLL